MAVFQAAYAFELFAGAPRPIPTACSGTSRTPRRGVDKRVATVCLSGTLEEKLLAALRGGLRRRRALRAGPHRLPVHSLRGGRAGSRAGPAIALYQPFRDFEAVPDAVLQRNLRRAEAKFDRHGGPRRRHGARLLHRASRVPLADDDLAAEQLHALAERAAARGLRVAYEALAWGRHVSEYEHAWRIVAAGRPSGARRLPGLLPRPLTRHRPGGHPRDPCRQAVLPAARRCAAPAHGRPAVEPPLPLLPGQGAFDLTGFSRHVLARRRRRPPVARGLQRRLPPGRSRSAPRSTRCDPCSSWRMGSGSGRCPRPPLCGATRSPSSARRARLGGGRRADPRCPRLPPRRPAPVQAGAALGQRRSPRPAQPRRRARRRRRGTRRRERGRARLGAARGGAARPGARQAAQRRRGGPRSGRRARRDVGVLRRRRRGMALGLRRARRHPAPRDPDARDRPRRPVAAVRRLRRGGALLPDAARPGAGGQPGSRRAGRPRAQPGAQRRGGPPGAQRPRARRAGRAGAAARRVPVRRRPRRRQGDARARSDPLPIPDNYYDDLDARLDLAGSSRSSASWTSSSTATRAEARSCTATRRPSGACSSRWSSAGAATTATERPTRRSAWPRNVGRAPRSCTAPDLDSAAPTTRRRVWRSTRSSSSATSSCRRARCSPTRSSATSRWGS